MPITPVFPRAREATPPQPFAVEATITLEDRVAAALFTYRDLFAAARRRVLYALAWVLIVLVLVIAFQAWGAASKDGTGAFFARFLSDLFGIPGLPIPFILVPTLIYYFLLPAQARARLRRWYRDEKLDRSFTGTYRFETGGLMSQIADQTSAIACRRLNGIAETADHVFVQLKDIEDVVALPKRYVASDRIETLKQWASFCHVDSSGAAQPFAALEPTGEPIFSARFIPTEDDRAATLTWQQERPGMRRRRWRGFAIAFIITALLPPLLVVFAWLLDPERVPLRYSAPLLAEMFITDFWKWILGFWAIIALIILLHPWMRRSHARQISRQLHKTIRYYETEYRFCADHLDVVQDGLHSRFAWSAFDRVERKDDYHLLCLKAGEPLALPVRALEGERLALFERLVKEHIGEGRRTAKDMA